MGLIFAIMVVVFTLVCTGIFIAANIKRANSIERGISIALAPTLIIGLEIAAVLVLTHFYHFSW